MSGSFDTDTERHLIGGLLSGGDFAEILTAVEAADFHLEKYSRIFAAMDSVFVGGHSIDAVTVAQQLKYDGFSDITQQQLQDFGNEAYAGMHAAHISHYAKTISDHAQDRSLKRVLEKNLRSVDDPAKTPAEKLNAIQGEIMQLSASRPVEGDDVTRNSDLAMNAVLSIRDGTSAANRLSWGIHELDQLTGGLEGGKLTVLGARPSMGKTWFSLAPAWHAATHHNQHTMIVSLEMSRKSIIKRLVGQAAGLSVDDNSVKGWSDQNLRAFAKAAAKLDNDMLHIEDSNTVTSEMTSIFARARQYHHRHKLGLIVIDYLQLMSTDSLGRSDRRDLEISRISRGLKQLAGELDVPIIALSQLSRSVETRPNKRPMLSDLRESGGIEQDADVVMFLYREAYYDPYTEKPLVAEVNVAKNRDGETRTAELFFDPAIGRFRSLERQMGVVA